MAGFLDCTLPGYAPSCALGRLHDDAEPREPRDPRSWLSGHARRDLSGFIGATIFVELRDGSIFVGELEHVDERELELEVLGSFEPIVLDRRSVVGGNILPRHSYAERRVIVERQRRGLPACPPPTKKG